MRVALGQKQEKDPPGIAAGEIDAADRLAHPDREFAQHVVAGIVAVSVVDRLEEIDVEHHQRERLAAGRGLFGEGPEMALHVTAALSPARPPRVWHLAVSTSPDA